MPASTITVRSPGSYSRTRPSFAVERRVSPPSRSIETVPAPASTSEASSRVEGSETLGNAGPLEGVRTVRPGHLAAEPRGREHLAGIREPGRVEPGAKELHRLEVPLREELRHRARLVDADAVLAGERAARVDARVEDRGREPFCQLGPALD